MALRVTQGLMYNSFVSGMNRNLSALMDSNMQSSSQKKVNKPSDDPVAAGRIISSRATLDRISSYKENINMAMGWLNLADNALADQDGGALNLLSQIKALALDMASGDVTAENRLETSYQVREYFKQLITIANSAYAGNHIFGGHQTVSAPYEEALGATVLDPQSDDPLSLAHAPFNVSGKLDRSMIIQATSSGEAATATYRASIDGGKTWIDGLTPTGPDGDGMYTLTANGVSVRFPGTFQHEYGATLDYMVTAVDPENDHSNDNGTWIYIRPTAVYKGDDHDTQVNYSYGTTAQGKPEGRFIRDVAVRVDGIENGVITYSYSVDDGSNWTQISAPQNPPPQETSLPVPGGYLNFSDIDAGRLKVGDQFIIHPHRADINYQISDDTSIAVNMVGKDIFGGLYDYPGDGIGYAVPVDEQANLFEVVGDLLAALETNSQQGCQEALEKLDAVMQVVRTRVAEVGGRENRLIATQGATVMREYTEESTLSALEDVDVTELMTKLAQQQTAYNSVLKSSSMIMQMSLVNFL